ncbi:MAG: TIGR03621 family F420-dependent LLM class oxidoreductase [Acidimicrobiia bacterium]|nr:TIGR03621 family F420-dependent LLM class oxidoreductase [Acidimicrobiia bacterium]
MAPSRPFRFAITTHGVRTATAWKRLCRRAEALGYDSVLMSDHADNPLSPVPALAVAAQVTRTLRVGTLVLCNDFRHPVFAAKELATLDVLSGGRLEWGVGAGWLPKDYETTGLTMDERGVRVERLAESIAATKALFTGERVTFDGVHVQVQGLVGRPEPVQRPHPPLLIGGAGPRMLRLAGREADIVGVAPSLTTKPLFGRPPRETVPEALDRQIAEVRRAAGDRYEQIEINVVAFPAQVVDDRRARAEELAARDGSDPDQVMASPHALFGSVEEMVDQLEHQRERWDISYVAVPHQVLEDLAPVVGQLAGR